jgi:hypothetical protein
MALTNSERNIIRNAFFQGPSALSEQGFDQEETTTFLRRPEVMQEIQLLTREFEEHSAFTERTKFAARRGLSRLLNGATAVLARGLAGPQYQRDSDGNVIFDARGNPLLRDVEPTSAQLASAKEVLNQLNIADDRGLAGRAIGADINVTLMLQAAEETVKLQEDPSLVSEEQRALSREKVRNAIDILRPVAEAARAKSLGLGESDVKEEEDQEEA